MAEVLNCIAHVSDLGTDLVTDFVTYIGYRQQETEEALTVGLLAATWQLQAPVTYIIQHAGLYASERPSYFANGAMTREMWLCKLVLMI